MVDCLDCYGEGYSLNFICWRFDNRARTIRESGIRTSGELEKGTESSGVA